MATLTDVDSSIWDPWGGASWSVPAQHAVAWPWPVGGSAVQGMAFQAAVQSHGSPPLSLLEWPWAGSFSPSLQLPLRWGRLIAEFLRTALRYTWHTIKCAYVNCAIWQFWYNYTTVKLLLQGHEHNSYTQNVPPAPPHPSQICLHFLEIFVCHLSFTIIIWRCVHVVAFVIVHSCFLPSTIPMTNLPCVYLFTCQWTSALFPVWGDYK